MAFNISKFVKAKTGAAAGAEEKKAPPFGGGKAPPFGKKPAGAPEKGKAPPFGKKPVAAAEKKDLPKDCKECGAAIPAGEKECPKCGEGAPADAAEETREGKVNVEKKPNPLMLWAKSKGA